MASHASITRRRVLESVPAAVAAVALTAGPSSAEPEPSPFQGDGIYCIDDGMGERMAFIEKISSPLGNPLNWYKISYGPEDRAGDGTWLIPERCLPDYAPTLVAHDLHIRF